MLAALVAGAVVISGGIVALAPSIAGAAETRSISGTVTLPAGVPTEWKRAVEVTAATADGSFVVYAAASATTGAYRLTGLPAGELRVSFSAHGYLDGSEYRVTDIVDEYYADAASPAAATLVSTADGDVTGVDAALDRGGWLTGTVDISGLRGSGAGYAVMLTDSTGTQVRPAFGDGFFEADVIDFEIGAVPAGDYRIAVTTFEFDLGTGIAVPRSAQFLRSGPTSVFTVSAGAEAALTLTARVPQAIVSGTVTTEGFGGDADVVGGAVPYERIDDEWVRLPDTLFGAAANGATEYELAVPAGTYTMGFEGSPDSDVDVVPQWWSGAATLAEADPVTVADTAVASDIDGTIRPDVSVAPSAPGAFVSVDPARLLDTRATSAIPAGGTVELAVTGNGGVPASGVSAVVMNVTAVSPQSGGFLTAYPTGSAQPTASNVNFAGGQTIPNLVTVKVGTGGKVSLTNNSGGSLHVIADVAGYYLAGAPTVPGAFASLDPARLLDTRATGFVRPGSAVEVQVTSRGGVPASGVSAVVMNVTAVSPATGGFVTAYPSGGAQPTASNLNFGAGQTIPNLVTVKIGAGGKVALANNSGGTVHLIADVAGYYLDGMPVDPGAFVSVAPARLLDTRTGTGAPKSPVGASRTARLQVTGTGGLPASGVAAVVMNVTAVTPSAGGFVTAYPTGTSQPTASNLNFSAGQTIPNLVAVKVGDDGRVSLTNNAPGTVQLIADVAGYFLD